MFSFSLKSLQDWLLIRVAGPPLRRGRRALARGKPARAAAIWHDAARAGDVDCQLALAEALWNGQGVLRDLRAAMQWYEKAADAGKAPAQARLAGIHAAGIGGPVDQGKSTQGAGNTLVVPRDRAKARHWARLAGEQGHIEAQVLLGWLHSMDEDEGEDKEGRDISLAIDWYSRAAEAGSAPAMVGLAGLISLGKVPGQGPEDAHQLYRRAAELGNKTAFYYLGVNLLYGTGVEADAAEGRKWLLRAADLGVAGAMRALGLACLRGSGGVPADPAQAETWLRRGAVKGDPESMVLLADMHAAGTAQVPNRAEAILWYVAASETGHPKAITALGIAHLTGNGVQEDHARAVELFEKAAEKHADARFKLGVCHLLGRGVPVDPVKAAGHLLKAAEQKHPDATYNYGALLYNGNGVAQDRKAAFEFYSAAAELGSASGQFRMAHAHTLGKEMPLDPHRAIELFTAAAEQEHTAAQINLARMLLAHRPDDRAALEKWRDRLRVPAQAGVVEAITVLAELLWRLDGDADGALALLNRSASMGDPMAAYVRDMIRPARTSLAITAGAG